MKKKDRKNAVKGKKNVFFANKKNVNSQMGVRF